MLDPLRLEVNHRLQTDRTRKWNGGEPSGIDICKTSTATRTWVRTNPRNSQRITLRWITHGKCNTLYLWNPIDKHKKSLWGQHGWPLNSRGMGRGRGRGEGKREGKEEGKRNGGEKATPVVKPGNFIYTTTNIIWHCWCDPLLKICLYSVELNSQLACRVGCWLSELMHFTNCTWQQY